MSAQASLDGLLAAAADLRVQAVTREPDLMALPLAGIGWATVELDRAAAEIAEAFMEAGIADPAWARAARDPLLGASARVTGGHDGRPAIVLLEPDTEGRLAATLARFGEGVAAIYLDAASQGETQPARPTRFSPGPLGPSRLALPGPAWGPHVIVVERPGPDAAA